MYCPRCLVEYRESFTICSDCHVKLVAGAPPEPAPPEPDLELVTVFEDSDPVVLALVKSTLEEARIRFIEKGEVYLAGGRPSYMLDWFGNSVCILVRKPDEQRALNLLRDLAHAPAKR